ncbi:class I SAM-dependent methyltransferase [Longimicrobium sp.]|uniref:class I SAM-dependent methyltransferase n=1 Tax=Longimicrobium sp. TaxID=2029185 RepID=UPI002B626027|nr:class I SAM-dependent methyltransferase [Longimicrobium sp.]HSU14963.1 class I SAM-dependent methyltransferase [Longimicrobium sp.]
MTRDSWASGDAYERYIGRWSRPVAAEFVRWLGVPDGREWVDVGCGTGALAAAILDAASPRRVRGYDLSPDHVAAARERVDDPRAEFAQADATHLPDPPHACDAAVSGLVLNFVPEPARAVAEMRRVVRPGGVVAAYVWDYAGEMQLIRTFWDAAVELDPAAAQLDEGRRFPICRPEPLRALFASAGLGGVDVRAIDIPTRFRDFDDYWEPFLGGQGPAPGYAVSLDDERRGALRERIRSRLPISPDGGITLTARAWAARGTAPPH